MTVKSKQLDEKIQTGGGATGVAHNADPVAKTPHLPASDLSNGEKMNTIARIEPGEAGSETDTENNTKPTKNTAGSNKDSVSAKASAAVKEDVAAMLAGEDLSEAFKEKATVIFEAAVSTRVQEAIVDLEEQYNTALQEEVATIHESMTEKIDSYMSYVTEQWMQENKVAIEHSLRTEITETFITKLKGLFEESHITVPEEKFDVVESMQTSLEEMQTKLDAVLEENIQLKGQLNESTRKEIVASMSDGLAATQVDKLVTLAEGVEFESAEAYRKKLAIVKETYFPSDKTQSTKQSLLEEINEDASEPTKAAVTGPVSIYAQAISRTVKNK